MATNFPPFLGQKSPDHKNNYKCNVCDIITSNKKDYKKHLMTKKHGKMLQMLQSSIFCPFLGQKSPDVNKSQCVCGKKYTHMSSLFRHRKTCEISQQENQSETASTIEITDSIKTQLNNVTPMSGINNQELMIKILRDNQEFKELLIEQNEKMIELVKEGKVINNTTNIKNKFNMNIFLNEKCANAINIMDFINQLQLQLTDLEDIGQLGYVDGISKIFIRELKELDVTQRPIHCSDLKREVMYIKDNNEWEKDEERSKMKKVIQHISHKNMKQLKEWKEKNPEFMDSTSKKNEQFMKILNKACGANNEEDEKFYNKIIKNVAKEVIIVDK